MSPASPGAPAGPGGPGAHGSTPASGVVGVPERVVGRWGEALLAPEAPSEAARAVLEALGGPAEPLTPEAPRARRARGPDDPISPAVASAATADEPASTARLRCPEAARAVAADSTGTAGYAGMHPAAVPPAFPPQTLVSPAALAVGGRPEALRPAVGAALTGPTAAGAADSPDSPDSVEFVTSDCPSAAETGVWVDPDDLPMSIGPDADDAPGADDALADREVPREASAAPSSTALPPERIPRYPEPEPGSGRRRRRVAASSPPESSAPARAAEETGGSGAPDGNAADREGDAASPVSFASSARGRAGPIGAPGPDSGSPPSAPSEPSASTGALAQEVVPVPMITAAICVVGHANPPDAHVCLCCPAPLSGQLVPVPRPVLAMLALSTGMSVPVRGDIVVGRAPREQPGGEPGALLLEVPSPTHLVSRSHLSITTAGWNVLARDLSSNNGTVLLRPGMPAVLLAPALPTPLYVGDLLDVGDGVALRVEPPI